MKKIIFIFTLVFVLGGASQASASTCGNPSLNHPEITTVDPITLAVTVTPSVSNVDCSGQSPELTVNVWGTMNSQLPRILQGQTVNGFLCPAFYPMYCVDISNTQYWKDRWGSVRR